MRTIERRMLGRSHGLDRSEYVRAPTEMEIYTSAYRITPSESHIHLKSPHAHASLNLVATSFHASFAPLGSCSSSSIPI